MNPNEPAKQPLSKQPSDSQSKGRKGKRSGGKSNKRRKTPRRPKRVVVKESPSPLVSPLFSPDTVKEFETPTQIIPSGSKFPLPMTGQPGPMFVGLQSLRRGSLPRTQLVASPDKSELSVPPEPKPTEAKSVAPDVRDRNNTKSANNIPRKSGSSLIFDEYDEEEEYGYSQGKASTQGGSSEKEETTGEGRDSRQGEQAPIAKGLVVGVIRQIPSNSQEEEFDEEEPFYLPNLQINRVTKEQSSSSSSISSNGEEVTPKTTSLKLYVKESETKVNELKDIGTIVAKVQPTACMDDEEAEYNPQDDQRNSAAPVKNVIRRGLPVGDDDEPCSVAPCKVSEESMSRTFLLDEGGQSGYATVPCEISSATNARLLPESTYSHDVDTTLSGMSGFDSGMTYDFRLAATPARKPSSVVGKNVSKCKSVRKQCNVSSSAPVKGTSGVDYTVLRKK